MTRQYQSHVSNSMQTCFESILHNNIPLNHDHVPRRLPCGVEGWDCWNIVGVSQISDIFCTKLLQGVPDVSCVPSAHSMSWSFLGLSPTFCHLTSSLPLFVLCLPHPSYQFWYLNGRSVVHALPVSLFLQIHWQKCQGKEKISNI